MNDEEYSNRMSHKNENRGRYTVAKKLEIVRKAKAAGNRTVARSSGIDEKRIREWRKQVRLL